MHEQSRMRGFTLVEMAIVLVIIGLIVGGVLVGQSLIAAAQMRSVMSEGARLEEAVIVFRDKYACLPGDCVNAATQLPGATNGDGNGFVDSRTAGGLLELLAVFDHLNRANLLSAKITNITGTSAYPQVNGTDVVVPGFNIPASKYPGAGYVISGSQSGISICGAGYIGNTLAPTQCNKNIIMFGGEGAGHNWWAWGGMPQPVFTCTDMEAMDRKFDDGKPTSGKLQLPGPNMIGANCYSGTWPDMSYTQSATLRVVMVFMPNF